MYSSRERMYPHWYHSWCWTRFSQVLTRMSGNLIVLTWQSFSSRYDSFNLVKIARVNCNHCDLVTDVVVKVGCCKFHIGKLEVLSLKFEVRNFGVPSLPPLLSSISIVSHPHASPNLRGGGRRRKDRRKGMGSNWLFVIGIFLLFRNSISNFKLRASTSSSDVRN